MKKQKITLKDIKCELNKCGTLGEFKPLIYDGKLDIELYLDYIKLKDSVYNKLIKELKDLPSYNNDNKGE